MFLECLTNCSSRSSLHDSIDKLLDPLATARSKSSKFDPLVSHPLKNIPKRPQSHLQALHETAQAGMENEMSSKENLLRRGSAENVDSKRKNAAKRAPNSGRDHLERDPEVPGRRSSDLTPGRKGSRDDARKKASHESKKIEHQEYYHGRLPRDELAHMFQEDGDFVVRESLTKADRPVVISVYWSHQACHFPISYDLIGGVVSLGNVSYPTVTELVQHFMRTGMPIGKVGAVLKRPLPKCKFLLNHEDLELGDKIGEGAFGEVKKAVLTLGDSKMDCAVKVNKDSDKFTKELKNKFLAEARIMKRYSHPNVLALIGICSYKDPLMIVTELMWMGLDKYFDTMRREDKHCSEVELTKFCVDAAAGMEYLSRKKCIHGDLAMRNCLLDKEKVLKISDFGMSSEGSCCDAKKGQSEKDRPLSKEEICKLRLPWRWCAPEILTYGEVEVSPKSDVWSFGVLMYEIFTEGAMPYAAVDRHGQMQEIEIVYAIREERVKLSPPEKMTPHLGLIMTFCLKFEKEKRPNFREVHRKLHKEYELMDPSAPKLEPSSSVSTSLRVTSRVSRDKMPSTLRMSSTTDRTTACSSTQDVSAAQNTSRDSTPEDPASERRGAQGEQDHYDMEDQQGRL